MKRFIIPRVAHCSKGCSFSPGQDVKLPVLFIGDESYRQVQLAYLVAPLVQGFLNNIYKMECLLV